MSGWQVGDLALCVAIKHPMFDLPSSILHVGAIYTVSKVGRPIHWAHGERALGFSDVLPKNADNGFPETLFRKIEAHEPDAFDRETIELLNRQPVPETVS